MQTNTIRYIIVGAFIGFACFFLFNRLNQPKINQAEKLSVISGSIDLNGAKTDESTISIFAKKSGEADFKEVVNKLPATDRIEWHWDDAVNGETYDIKAVFYVDGKNQGESNVMTITAPAVGEIFIINSRYVPSVSKADVSGSIDLNGAVTDQSFLTLYKKELAASDFQIISDGILAKDGTQWSWNGAEAGKQYQFKAVLTVNGQYAGESQKITVTAPADNEVLRINSQYQPPNKKASISGNVGINGVIQSGSTLAIYKKTPSDNQYVKIIDGVKAIDGMQWVWNDAVAGEQYKIYGTVWNNGNSLGQSPEITLAAPASNELLSINIGPNGNLQRPPNAPWVSCNNQSGSSWNVTFTFNTISGAQQYWFQIGSQNGRNDINDTKLAAVNQSTQTYTFGNITNNNTYFAQYAHSPCADCKKSSDFSPFSNELQFSCPASAPPTNTPAPATPTPTSAPTNTPIPSPTPTPKIAQCNESCGGDGYICVSGLDCVTTGAIGSGKCRNPSCTDKEDCNCEAPTNTPTDGLLDDSPAN